MPDVPVVPLVDALLLTVFLVLAASAVMGRIDKGHRITKAVAEGNIARSLLYAADVLAIILIATSAIANSVKTDNHLISLAWATAYGASATVVFAVLSRIGIRSLLEARLTAELDRGNSAAGVAAAGHSLATGIITANALGGDDLRGLGLSVVFFAIGQITLYAYVTLFRALTTYDDGAEILGENLAAALSYAGISIGLAIIVGRALEGSFAGWYPSLKAYGGVLLYGFGLLVARQVLVQVIILKERPRIRGGMLDVAIGRERNVAIAGLEAAVYIGTALCIARLG